MEKSEKEPAPPNRYDELFQRVAATNILPPTKSEWSLDELHRELEDAFYKYGSQSIRANDDMNIYTTLSGGLDSTLALAFLRSIYPNAEIHTITMGARPNHDDILHARLAAERFGTKHHEFIPDRDDINEALAEYQTSFPRADLEADTKSGDVDVFLLYKFISQLGAQEVIAHDGIDELMGGYPQHRWNVTSNEKPKAYQDAWNNLIPHHLTPLTKTAENFGITLSFPYLHEDVINAISAIPLDDRSDAKESKKPLRQLAREMGVPNEILTRSKRGQLNMLDKS